MIQIIKLTARDHIYREKIINYKQVTYRYNKWLIESPAPRTFDF